MSHTDNTELKGVTLATFLASVLFIFLSTSVMAEGASRAAPRQQLVGMMPQPVKFPEFSLIDHNGELFTRRTLEGKSTLLFFGYTHCPDVCPVTLSLVQEAFRRNASLRDGTRMVMVSVDPVRDTPQVLSDFVSYFDPRFIGATGSISELTKILSAVGSRMEYLDTANGKKLAADALKPELDYSVNHTPGVFVLNPQGEVYAYIVPSGDVDEFSRALGKLIPAPGDKAISRSE